MIALAGGYARNVEDTVAIHVATIEEAATTDLNIVQSGVFPSRCARLNSSRRSMRSSRH